MAESESGQRDNSTARNIGGIIGGAAGRTLGEMSGVPGAGTAGEVLGHLVGRTVADMPPSDDPGMREHFSRRCGR